MKEPPNSEDLPQEVVGAAINTFLSMGRALEETLDEDLTNVKSILADAAIMATWLIGEDVADIEDKIKEKRLRYEGFVEALKVAEDTASGHIVSRLRGLARRAKKAGTDPATVLAQDKAKEEKQRVEASAWLARRVKRSRSHA